MAYSIDYDQTSQYRTDLGLRYLFRPICPNTYKYGITNLQIHSEQLIQKYLDTSKNVKTNWLKFKDKYDKS